MPAICTRAWLSWGLGGFLERVSTPFTVSFPGIKSVLPKASSPHPLQKQMGRTKVIMAIAHPLLPTIATHSYFWFPSKDETSLWPETKNTLGCSDCEDLCPDPTGHPSSSKTSSQAKVERPPPLKERWVFYQPETGVSLTTGHG